jgi:uncharacterized DUF497 family protein
VRFVWDRRKSVANLALRGFDFAFASLIFDVVYTDRGTGSLVERRIISARRSNRRERQAYQAALEG